MKRNFLFLILLTLFIIFFTGCNVQQEANSSSELGITSSNSDTSIPSQINLPDFAFFLNINSKSPIENSYKNYQSNEPYFKTLSFIVNQVDKSISNVDYDGKLNLYNFQKHVNNVYSVDYYDENSTLYEMLSDETIVYSYIGENQLPENKVTYINYLVDQDHQPKQEWTEYFQGIIFNETGVNDTPIIIQESFKFEIDGLKAYAVNAGNLDIFYDYEQIHEMDNNTDNIKPISPFLKYRLSSIFIEGYEPISVFTDIKIYTDTKFWRPIQEGETFDTQTVYIYAQDINGVIKRFPYSSTIATDRTSTTHIEYFICDIDNNGIEDIAWVHEGQGSHYISRGAISLKDGEVIKRSLYPIISDYII